MKYINPNSNHEKEIENLFSSVSVLPRNKFKDELEGKLKTVDYTEKYKRGLSWHLFITGSLVAGLLLLVLQTNFATAQWDKVAYYTSRTLSNEPVTELPIAFIFPTSQNKIISYFDFEQHASIHIAGKVGDDVFASAPGKVEFASCDWNGGYGCMVLIDHGNGIRTIYAHLDKILVQPEEEVLQGSAIGNIGTTGRVMRETYLHFELLLNEENIDPLLYLH